MMITCLAACLFASFATPTPPSLIPTDPYELVSEADVIVTGKIIELEAGVFTLEVERWIWGEDPKTTLRIERFKNWTCGWRFAPYQKGERLVAFVRRSKNPGVHRVDGYTMGGAAEGEWPILGDEALCHHGKLKGFPLERRFLRGPDAKRNVVRASVVSIDSLAKAIVSFRETFVWEYNEYGSAVRFRPRVSLAAAARYANTSKLARHLHDEVLSSSVWEPIDEPNPVEVLGRLSRLEWPRGQRPVSMRGTGSSLAFLDDLDGDGIAEIAVGTPGDRAVSGQPGVVKIRFQDGFGRTRRIVAIETRDLGPAARKNFCELGSAVASPGDVNSDGIPDLAVGAKPQRGSNGRPGGLWILLLNSDGTVAHASDLAAMMVASGVQLDETAELGTSLAALGDLDGDGGPEIAVGALVGGHDREPPAGIWIISLALGGEPRWIKELSSESFGASSYSKFGATLAAPGDLDGDGYAELVVGAPSESQAGTGRGALHVLSLDGRGEVRKSTKIDDRNGDFKGLLLDGSHFGRALATPGDLDGDGTPDLIVGSESSLWTLFLTPEGMVREHTRIGAGYGGFTDTGRIRGGIVCVPDWEGAGVRLIAEGLGDVPLLWDLLLCPDGSICSR